MNPWPVDAEVEESHLPRPGHADLVGSQKYGHSRRPQRARARLRARDGGAGRRRRRGEGVPARARRRRVQPCTADRLGRRRRAPRARAGGLRRGRRLAGPLPRPRCRTERWSRRSIGCARQTRASAGVFEVRAFGLVPGLGSYVSWDARLDGRLARRGRFDPGGQGGERGGGLGGRGLARLGIPRRDLLVGRARLSPRDQPRGRRRGRDVERRAARRPRRR